MSPNEKRTGPSRSEVNAKKRMGRPPKPKPEELKKVEPPVASPKSKPEPIESSDPDGAVRLSFGRFKKGIHYCDTRPDGSVWGGKIKPGDIGVFYDPGCIRTLLKHGADRVKGPVHAAVSEDKQVQAICQKPADK